MHRVLVLRGGALGDFIVTLPALAALRQGWPAARLELAGNATAAQLALTRGLLDAVHSQHEARWAALYSAAPLSPDFAAWLASFDLVLNYWPDPAGELARHFPLHAAQRFLSAPAHPTLSPAAAHYGGPLRALGLTPENFHSLTWPQPAARLIAIHPGSGSPAKNWPLPRWLELCAWLKHTHRAELLLITGEAESPATRAALAPFGRAAHQLPLEQLVGALAECRLFLGHDSGVSHLAAACGVPSLLLFGPTDPALWAPRAAHVRVLKRGPTLSEISLSDAQAAIAPLLSAQI